MLTQARELYRTANETRRLGARPRLRLMKLGAMLFLAPLLCSFLFYLAWQMKEWSGSTASVALVRSDWKTLFDAEVSPCPNDAVSDPACPANPKNAALWSSSTKRSDVEHIDRVRAARGKTFWIGTVLSKRQLESAFSAKASVLELGYIAGGFRIWIEGRELLPGSYAQSPLPLSIPLPLSMLSSGADIHVAIEIHHDLGAVYPDYLGGEVATGLSTYHQAGVFAVREAFRNQARPWVFFAVNLLLGLIFLYLWNSAPRKQEFFYFALFVLNHAFIEFQMTDGFRRWAGFSTLQYLEIYSMWCEAVLVLVAALAFARVRLVLTELSLLVALLFPMAALPFFAHADAYIKNFIFSLIAQSTVPVGAIGGAIACWLQGYWLKRQGLQISGRAKRIRRLTYFGWSTLAIAAVYFIQGRGLLGADQFESFYRVAFFGLVLLLARIVAEDYREEQRIVEVTPLSEYHRRGVAQVSGSFLSVDLKGSQFFYQQRAENQSNEDLIAGWRAQMYSVIQRNGGSVVFKKGDEIIALFDQEKHPEPVSAALKACREMTAECAWIEERLRQEQKVPQDWVGLFFRGAIVLGCLRPILEKIEGREYPEWAEAEGSTPFVEASRVLGCEKTLGFSKAESVLLLSAEAAKAMGACAHSFPRKRVETKDGVVVELTVIELRALSLDRCA